MDNNDIIYDHLEMIVRLSKRYSEDLSDQDRVYYRNYADSCIDAIDNGYFGVVNGPWNEYNFRYGIDSVRGNLSELLATICFNKHSRYPERLSRGNGTWEEEVNGCDLRANFETWKRSYPVQVKSVPRQQHIPWRSEWAQYRHIDRMIFVCPSTAACLSIQRFPQAAKHIARLGYWSFDDILNGPDFYSERSEILRLDLTR